MTPFSCKDYCLQHHRYPNIKKPEHLKKLSLVLFDMDGVLVDVISSWKFIHSHYQMNNDASVKAYVKGEIDDKEFISRDVSIWMNSDDPMNKEKLDEMFSSLPLMTGAYECLQWINEHQIKSAIVSAGIKTLANRIARELDIDFVYANELLADENGFLTGEGIVEVSLKEKDKTVQMVHETTNIPCEEMVAVGNSCYDIPMLSSVGLSVVFRPTDDCVLDCADEIIREKDLSLLIPILERYQ